jgi:hypothetical protein
MRYLLEARPKTGVFGGAQSDCGQGGQPRELSQPWPTVVTGEGTRAVSVRQPGWYRSALVPVVGARCAETPVVTSSI